MFYAFLASDKHGGKEIQSRKSQTGIAKDTFLKTNFVYDISKYSKEII
jgi:hypothetical protein